MPLSPADTATLSATLTALDDAARARLAREGQVVRLPPGARAFRPGQACGAFLLVLDGSVKVQLTAESGREIILYRVGPGESCVLTTSCLLAAEDYSAEGIAENDVTALAVPVPAFRLLLAESERFRDYVLGFYATRITDLVLTLEETAFRRIDARLAEALVARGEGVLTVTHQGLATELGSVREVVSRKLKQFERAGLVALGRGTVSVVDRAGLKRIASGAV